MKRGRLFLLYALIVFTASFVFASDAMAADPSGEFTGLLDLIKQNSNNWFTALKGYAINIFWMLALIQLVWTFFPLVFKQADLGELAGEIIRFVIVIGFFYLLLDKSQEYGGYIVDSFRTAGSKAAGLGTTTLTPGGIFDVAVEMANTIGSVETWNPLTAMMIALAGLVVLLCFAFIAAFMGLTIIESYIVINASVLFMGFGGSTWTRDYAIAMLRYAVAVGAKLFVLTLLVGLVIQSAQQWQDAYNNTDQASMWTMIGLALACAYFCKTLPELVAGLISGVSPGGGASAGGMAAAGVAGAAAAVGAIATLATAGAAAPAAAAATSAAGGAAGSAAGGGLASSLSSSIAGGAANAAGAGAGASGAGASSAGASGIGSATGGSTAGGSTASKAAKAAMNGTGSDDKSNASAAGQQQAGKASTKAASGSGDGSANAGGSGGSVDVSANVAQETGEASSAAGSGSADGAANAGQEASSSTNAGSSSGSGMRAIASGAMRGAGVLSAISVPGMEASAGLSLASAPPASISENKDDGDDFSSTQSSTSENVIRAVETNAGATTTATPSTPAGGRNGGER